MGMKGPAIIAALSRPALLPTVWSNCLAGWWLGGGGNHLEFAVLLMGATFLHLGGAFLNDAFDEEHDRQHHPTRPIPSGAIAHDTVFHWGLGWLVAGALALFWLGRLTAVVALVLVFLIVLYNTTHRLLPFAPVIAGTCRLLLYVLGSSVAAHGVNGWTIWCGLVLAGYVSGLGYLAERGHAPARVKAWPVLLLALPIILALIMDAGPYREAGLLLSAVVLLWCLRSLRPTFWSPGPDLSRTISGLLAGIVFVDWLAVCPLVLAGQASHGPRQVSIAFLALFGACLLLERIPTAAKPAV